MLEFVGGHPKKLREFAYVSASGEVILERGAASRERGAGFRESGAAFRTLKPPVNPIPT